MVKTDNRTIGGQFEQELSHALADEGFWVHVMQQNKSGQPADIIAIRGRFHTLIDCKIVSDNNGFLFSRIEDNQRSAMRMFLRKCGELCYFAIKLPDESIWMVSLERLETLRIRGNKKISDHDIRTQTRPLEKWLEESKLWSEDI